MTASSATAAPWSTAPSWPDTSCSTTRASSRVTPPFSSKDIPPFVLQQGYNYVSGLNVIGLRRAGMPTDTINALRDAFRILYKEGRTLRTALDMIEADLGHVPEVVEFLTFVSQSTLGINPGRTGDRIHQTF
jgi:hypothetical protein